MSCKVKKKLRAMALQVKVIVHLMAAAKLNKKQNEI